MNEEFLTENMDKEIDQEIKEERNRENLQEVAEGSYLMWRDDNLEDLKSDFIENNDDFEAFCLEEYNNVED